MGGAFDPKKFEEEIDAISDEAVDSQVKAMAKGAKGAISGILTALGLSVDLAKAKDEEAEEDKGDDDDDKGDDDKGDDEPGYDDMQFSTPEMVDIPGSDDESLDVTKFVEDLAKATNSALERSVQTEEELRKLRKAVMDLSAQNKAFQDLFTAWATADAESQGTMHKGILSTRRLLLDVPAATGPTLGRQISRRREVEELAKGKSGNVIELTGANRLTKGELNKGLKADVIDWTDVQRWQRNGTFGGGDELDAQTIARIKELP